MTRVIRLSAWMSRHSWLPWGMLLVALLFGGIAPLLPIYDSIRPIVVMQSKVIERAEDSVTVHLTGDKNRDCRYVSMSASTKAGDMYRSAQILRVDMPSTGRQRPIGKHDFGVWRVWPLGGGALVAIHVQYDCDGRYVLAKATEVKL